MATYIPSLSSYKVYQNPDGSLTRNTPYPIVPIDGTNNSSCKDVTLNSTTNTSLRIFIPRDTTPNPNKKLPVVVFFHGGGFILNNAATNHFHDFCTNLATKLNVVILSLDYRLAPENRLPAAYDDAMEAVKWVRDQALHKDNCDTWMREYVDFSRCYLMGISSGANMVYHESLRCIDIDLSPVKIKGSIINQPFFGGVKRTPSEMRLMNDQKLPLAATDQMWAFSLPVGADRDHEFSNPMLVGSDDKRIRRLQRCLVLGHEEDPLVDRQKEFAKMLQEHDVDTVSIFRQGGCHGAEYYDPDKLEILCEDIREFIYGASSASEASVSEKEADQG